MFENLIEEYDPELIFTVLAIFTGFLYGFLAQRKQFCFSGSIKDLLLFKHTKRAASVILAIMTAIISTQMLAYNFDIDLTMNRYYMNINYLFIILGGVMFGFGMMISDGCSSRHLVKAAQGERESFFILIALGVFSCITYSSIIIFNEEIYSNPIVQAGAAGEVFAVPFYIPLIILGVFLYKSINSIKDILQCWDGILIGLLISLVWFITTDVANELFISISAQSLSFVYPIGKVIEYIKEGFDADIMVFSAWTVLGVALGSFISSRFNKEFSKKQMCDNTGFNPPKLRTKLFGGALMGIGGILAVGCTVGQGLSGLSSLSFASFVAVVSIYGSGYITATYLKKNNALIACFIFDFKK